MKNRLKTVRKAKRLTQKQIADFIGINQNTYSYWESGKVKIDNESITKLADYYNVPSDFLLGRKYIMKNPPEKWHFSMREDYSRADEFEKEYMEYLYGEIEFIDAQSPKPSFDIFSIPGIRPLKTKKLPLLGKIACGKPIFADEEYDGYIEVDECITADFCLRAQGDSMINARIYDGDIVFVKQQPSVDNGEIAVVLIGDEATLKRVFYYPEKQKLILSPENPNYEPFVFIGEELNEIKILGKAVVFQSIVR